MEDKNMDKALANVMANLDINKLRFRCRYRDRHMNNNKYNEYHFKDLVIDNSDGHIDYRCPECNSVMICGIELGLIEGYEVDYESEDYSTHYD